jgi:hypothetical protein
MVNCLLLESVQRPGGVCPKDTRKVALKKEMFVGFRCRITKRAGGFMDTEKGVGENATGRDDIPDQLPPAEF